jgi:hypothetical protein
MFASDFFNSIGPKPKWLNVRFCAAVGGQADIKRASPGFLIL